jgi:3-hydroxyisobutyrate dehydrogenase-like beta-hydroxyacid dehydrogenase
MERRRFLTAAGLTAAGLAGAGEVVGQIGVGLLGAAMAERFLKSGFGVLGFDIDPARLKELERMGGKAARSNPEVAQSCRRIVLSLPHSGIVKAVLDEIEASLRDGAIVIDTSTGEPEEMAGFAARLIERRVWYVDATVGGSSRQTRERDAIAMCGGDERVWPECRQLLDCFSRQTFFLGPAGSGARMKLVNNLVLGLNRAVLAEGLGFAEATGVDPAKALEVLKAGPAWSRVMDVKGRKMLERDYTAEARLTQHLKDVRLILASGERSGARLPLSELHRRLLEECEEAGLGDSDNSAVAELFRRKR